MTLFDNGFFRVLDANGDTCSFPSTVSPCYSRAPIFQVDENSKTADVAWEYNAAPAYSVWGGNSQELDNGDVVFAMSQPEDTPADSRYLEVDQDAIPQVVLHIEVSGQNAYRMIHLPSLYPGVQWVGEGIRSKASSIKDRQIPPAHKL